MTYAKVNDQSLVKCPYGFADLRAENPYTDFGANNDIASLYAQTEAAQDGSSIVEVTILPSPEYNRETQRCIQSADPENINGEWVIGWVVTAKTPEELAADLANWRIGAACSPFQGKAALYTAGLLDDVEALIANPATDRLVKLAWDNAGEWRRSSEMISSLSVALSMTDAQVDELFKAAASINA